MADVVVERLITQLVFDGDVREYERAQGAVLGLAEAAFAANAALSALAASTASEITTYARLGEALGLGTQGAREMAAVFATTGAEINDVSDALQTLADYSLEATNGTQSFVDAFGQIGVTVDQLRGKKPDELLAIVADGMQRTEDVTKRAATASQLFGDDVGRKLLPILMHGADGIKALREEARVFGGVVSEEDATAARELTVDLRRLWYAVDGLRVRLGLALIPILRETTDEILAWMNANKEWLNLKIGQAVDTVAAAFRLLQSPLGLVVSGIGALAAAKSAAKAIGALSVALGMGEGALGAALLPLVGPAGALVLAAAAADDLYAALKGEPSVAGEAAKALGAGSEFQNALIATRDLFAEAGGFVVAFDTALYNLLPNMTTFTSYIPQLQVLSETFKALGLDKYGFDLGQGLDFIGGKISGAAGGFRAAREGLESGAISPGQVGATLAGGLVDPFGLTTSVLTSGRGWDRLPSSGPQSVQITVNADGLTAAEAEHVARRVVDTEIRGAYDASAQGVR